MDWYEIFVNIAGWFIFIIAWAVFFKLPEPPKVDDAVIFGSMIIVGAIMIV